MIKKNIPTLQNAIIGRLIVVIALFFWPASLLAQVPDGVEDITFFPKGYWATTYYEGRDGSVGANPPYNQSANGSGSTTGSKTFRGEVNWGIGESNTDLSANGSSGNRNRWANNETPTDPILPTTPTVGFPNPANNTGYVGSTWAGSNPHYQIDFRRTVTNTGVLRFATDLSTDILDDTLEIFVNGTRVFAYFPGGGAPNPRPGPGGPGTPVVIPLNDNDEVLIRFINLGFIGGLQFTFETPLDSIQADDDTAVGVLPGTANVLNVLDNDLYADNPATITAVNLAVNAGSSVPPELTFNPATGEVGVVPGTPSGVYTFDYDICAENPSTNCDTATVSITVFVPNPSLSVTKVADLTSNVAVGQTITYTYTVTNDGNQVISNIELNDVHNGSNAPPDPQNEALLIDNAPLGDSFDSANDGIWETLAPGDVITYTGTYEVTQSDVDNLQ